MPRGRGGLGNPGISMSVSDGILRPLALDPEKMDGLFISNNFGILDLQK